MLKTVSLYSGAGGLDLGLEAAGFEVTSALEMDGSAVETLRANRPGWEVLHRRVEEVSSAELMSASGLREGDADLLCGGPPCQPFSKSGYWSRGDSRRLDDPRADTLDHYLRILRDLKPRTFLLENVPGLAFSEKDEGLVLIKRTVEQINRECGTSYDINAAQLNACGYGVPQTRERVFIVGHREGRSFTFPRPTHALPPRIDYAQGGVVQDRTERDPSLLAPTTAWDAIGHLDGIADSDPTLRVKGKWADLLPSIPEGWNYLWFTDRGGGRDALGGRALWGWRTRFWSMLLKLAKDRPSWTLTAQPGPAIGPFHWRSRRLSADELCGIQTFPRNYAIRGGAMSALKQIGNAVPSALAERLGLEIRSQLLGDSTAQPTNVTLLPERSAATPPPEPVAPVPAKYLTLAGTFEDHPGAGRGPGAVARATLE